MNLEASGNSNAESKNEVVEVAREVASTLRTEFHKHSFTQTVGTFSSEIQVDGKEVPCGTVHAYVDPGTGMIVELGNLQEVNPDIRDVTTEVSFVFREDTDQIVEITSEHTLTEEAIQALKLGVTEYNHGLEPKITI